MTRYRYVTGRNGEGLYDVGLEPDGSLYNPKGYPEADVRSAVLAADERRQQRRSNAGKKGAATRQLRTAKRVYQAAKRLAVNGSDPIGPRTRCFICNRKLADRVSINRGIGSECWQDVLDSLAAARCPR